MVRERAEQQIAEREAAEHGEAGEPPRAIRAPREQRDGEHGVKFQDAASRARRREDHQEQGRSPDVRGEALAGFVMDACMLHHRALKPQALLPWSSGKDSACALHEVRRAGELEAVRPRDPVNRASSASPWHAVRSSCCAARRRTSDAARDRRAPGDPHRRLARDAASLELHADARRRAVRGCTDRAVVARRPRVLGCLALGDLLLGSFAYHGFAWVYAAFLARPSRSVASCVRAPACLPR